MIVVATIIPSVPLVVRPLDAVAAGSPTVTALSPEAGHTTGGTTVTVYGSNFRHRWDERELRQPVSSRE
jgi:hypothetical protein